MSGRESSCTVDVDLTNPGQFFACCGLLELAHRQWPGVEGEFVGSQFRITNSHEQDGEALRGLTESLSQCEISGLSKQERDERADLEREFREQKKRGQRLSPEKEKRRKELGERARAGVIRIGEPFALILDWWQTSDESAVPKTWAGLQELHKVARAAQEALSGLSEFARLFEYGCVLRTPREYRKPEPDQRKAVEPFYFDARRFAHALDVGFSLDAQEAETIAHPAVELLCLIGLQRFRPAAAPVKWNFDYWTWSQPLSAPVAAAVVSGVAVIPARQAYRFPLRFRDDQKRYKAFGFATLIGGDI